MGRDPNGAAKCNLGAAKQGLAKSYIKNVVNFTRKLKVGLQ